MPDLVLDSDDDSSEDDPEGYDAEDDAMPVLFPDDDDDDATPDLLSDSDDDDDDYYDCWRPATNTANQGAAAPRLAAVDSPGFRPGRLFTTRHGVQQRLFDVHTTAALADVRAPRRWSTSTGLDTWGVGPERSPAPASTSCFWSEVSSQAYLDTSPTLSGRWSHLDINISADIPAALAQRIRGWALRNANIFATTEFPPASKQFSEIVGAHDMNAELLDGCRPFHAGARSYKPKESEILKLWTRRNLEEGILVPNPTSPWASHIHLVSKQDSVKPRVVVDMRQVNERIRPRPGAMPDGIAELQRASTAARFRLSADALVCYGQFEVTPSSYDINTIHTPLGKMAYTRLTMGYQPASRVQQTYYTAAMDSLPPAVRPNVANFADDFNTWANDDDSFMERLDAFATMCTTYGIYLSPAKTRITGPSTDSRFYGFTLRSYDSGGGSTITTDSVGALQNMEMPTSTAEVRQILGLLNFSRLLVPHYASLVFPCTQLLKKDAFPPGTPFSLPSEAEAALRDVVQILTSSATRYTWTLVFPCTPTWTAPRTAGVATCSRTSSGAPPSSLSQSRGCPSSGRRRCALAPASCSNATDSSARSRRSGRGPTATSSPSSCARTRARFSGHTNRALGPSRGTRPKRRRRLLTASRGSPAQRTQFLTLCLARLWSDRASSLPTDSASSSPCC